MQFIDVLILHRNRKYKENKENKENNRNRK
jgi:hypothetical protein